MVQYKGAGSIERGGISFARVLTDGLPRPRLYASDHCPVFLDVP
jgi:hypothetical protein